MAQCATTALAGAVLRLCVRGARGWFGGVRAGTWCCVSLLSPSPPRVARVACGGPSRPGVPYPRSLVRHSTQSVRSARSVRLPFWWSPRVPFVCVRSRSRGVRPPLPWVVWRAHLAWSRHWALVGPFDVVRAPPRVLPRSLAPSGVLGGGRPGPGSPLLGLGLWGWRQGVPGGGAFYRCEGRPGSCAPPPPCGCGGPTLSPWPACPVGAACRGGGGGPSPGGLACHRCEGRLVSGAVPPPAACPLERAAWVPRPVCPGCGRCGRGDPAPAQQRAPLRAGVARCGGGGRASPGGVPSTIVRGV